MKKIILSATALSGLLLTGCIPLDGKKVGVDFNFETEAEQVLENVTAEALPDTGANEGVSFKSNFDPAKSKFSAEKGTSVNILSSEANVTAKIKAISNGTSRIFNDQGTSDTTDDVWDRVQNHPITVDLEVDVSLKVNLFKPKEADPDDALINKANVKIEGDFGTDSVAAFQNFESDPNNALQGEKVGDLEATDFIPDGSGVGIVISDGSLIDYATSILVPFKDFKDEELYGAYRKGNQYTGFYAAGTEATVAADVANNTITNEYDVNFRGIANWNGTSYNKLGGTGNLAVNFSAGTYTGDINVKNGSSDIGIIAFDGDSTNTTTFSDAGATYTPTGASAVTGYVEGSAYGDSAATFMGTADFADGSDVLVGAFNATPTTANEQ